MPTVLRVNGFRFMIYQMDDTAMGEHGPAHVHAFKAGERIVINIETVVVRTNIDMSRANALVIVEDNQALFAAAWRRING